MGNIWIDVKRPGEGRIEDGTGGMYHETMNQVQDSTRENMDSTTQYMSHGVS